MVWRQRSRVRSVELGFALILALSFAAAVYLRFSSGWFPVSDRPDLHAYAGLAAIGMATWSVLASRLCVSGAIIDDRDPRSWLLLFSIANLGTLTLVGAAALLWRAYPFSRLTLALAWLIFTLAGAAAALLTRRWAASRRGRVGGELMDPARAFDYEVAKRAFDVAGATILLIASAPLLGAWLLWAAITATGPVLIRQQRIGRLERRFDMLKLRTLPLEMLATADRDWSVPATSGAMSFVRRTGLDELPQLWNVLCGDMSLVGPRPERPYFVQLFTEQLPDYPARHQLRPGLTGWAQIHGLRGDSSIARRLEYDLQYLQRWSLGLDARILLMTGWAVVRDLFHSRGLAEGGGRMTDRLPYAVERTDSRPFTP